MNLLTPPTDSLYKFMAIAGLIIIILSMSIPINQAIDTDHQINRVLEDHARLEVINNQLQQGIQRRQETLARTKKALKQNAINPVPTYADIQLELDKREQFEINNALLKEKADAIRRLQKDNNLLFQIGYVFVGVGTYVTFQGFYLWYHKLQKHQDIITQSEAKKILVDISDGAITQAQTPIAPSETSKVPAEPHPMQHE